MGGEELALPGLSPSSDIPDSATRAAASPVFMLIEKAVLE